MGVVHKYIQPMKSHGFSALGTAFESKRRLTIDVRKLDGDYHFLCTYQRCSNSRLGQFWNCIYNKNLLLLPFYVVLSIILCESFVIIKFVVLKNLHCRRSKQY